MSHIQDTETVFCENNYDTQTTTSITGFNKTMTQFVEEKYESIKKQLDEIQGTEVNRWSYGLKSVLETYSIHPSNDLHHSRDLNGPSV